jgi:hypothetical protein
MSLPIQVTDKVCSLKGAGYLAAASHPAAASIGPDVSE